jgi:hypothetical protein
MDEDNPLNPCAVDGCGEGGTVVVSRTFTVPVWLCPAHKTALEFQGFSELATGGVVKDKLYIVGEQGPEIFKPDGDPRIVRDQ